MAEGRETMTMLPADLGRGRLYLLVLEGESSGIFRLPGSGSVVVGRGSEADLRVGGQASSRRHAMIKVAAGEAQVVDLDSRNGTRVNGERIDGPRPLSSGDAVA